VNSTIDGYANYLGSLGSAYGIPNFAFNPAAFGTCTSCPPNPKAVRNYDGVELRLTKATSHGWAGMFSYTYSSLWGNYTGLTTTDQIDGGTVGRDSPDTTRAFDEPFYYFGANGKIKQWASAYGPSEHVQGQRVLCTALEGWEDNFRSLPIRLPGYPVKRVHGFRVGLLQRAN